MSTLSTSPQTSQIPVPSPLKADAVFAGGGIRGIGHVGALMVAEQLGYQWVNIAGTSAGAMIAALLAAGYSATELYTIMSELDYTRFTDGSHSNYLSLQDIHMLLEQGGIHSGKYLEAFMREKLQAKGIEKFGDLIIKGQEDDVRFRYRLTVIATDITTGQLLRLPHDAHIYGFDPDQV
ncbi:MAG: patatin-like phospholipase family protein, partial [Chloroflexota bacterium]|nr:patatin-like phospholipase family protein [Chloroflexota bacterium]